jgi:hypothetical protein
MISASWYRRLKKSAVSRASIRQALVQEVAARCAEAPAVVGYVPVRWQCRDRRERAAEQPAAPSR